ncbi:SDR family NAD(P)-dependent oxidoreductase [Paenibacillus nasutitermitis]|uniref:Oxidoreductase n=1 Tax=Paenibacillus nasutitermitis TaxID=1652958 RepID=A0A916Z6N6_9BACL|nr:SDR family oxidoreductase [Paenibacillus nasutitermitis]GGD79091.1 oxidoreductase [Paenibacillus nasutitermitis]
MSSLQGKVLLITGGLGTLGRSAIRMFLDRGAVVFACDRIALDNCPDIGLLADQYSRDRFMFMQADMCSEEQVIAVAAAVHSRYGRLDGTYHNVYTNVWKPALSLSLPEWEDTIRGTLTSTFLLCKYALPLLVAAGGGSIVNTSSVLGQVVQKECLAYGAAKAGINQFTRVLAADYAQYGIRANVLVPGDFKPDEVLARQTEHPSRAIMDCTWLGRSGRADEINEVAAFLLSDASSYVTGSTYSVDGGFHI